MGLNFNMRLIMSGVLNVTQLIGVISSLWTMDRFGRRTLLLTGSVFMFIAHLIISVLVGKFSDNWPAHRAEGWASVAMLLFFMLAFGASWGPVPWALPSEIFPSSLRAKGVGLSTASNWFFNFIIVSCLREMATNFCDTDVCPGIDHATACRGHWLRSIRLLRCFLSAQLRMDILRGTRDFWQDAGTDGLSLQGHFLDCGRRKA